MKSNISRIVSICLLLILSVKVQSRYISIVEETSTGSETQIDCFSPKLTIRHLQAVAHNVKCSENNDREFWQLACNCAVNNLPESECPKCRVLRSAEGKSTNNGVDIRTTLSPFTGTRLTTEDGEMMNKKLRLFHNATSVSSSANFIRFGK